MTTTKVTKSDLIDSLAQNYNLTRAEAKRQFERVIDTITSQFASDGVGKVSVPGLGTLRVAHRPARVARNPQNGLPVTVESSNTVRFKPAPRLRTAVNGGVESEDDSDDSFED